MSQPDGFAFADEGLQLALDLLRTELRTPGNGQASVALPANLPQSGMGEQEALRQLSPAAIGGARHLGAPHAFAHMDPPTPWIAWATTLWNAALNQNLLHSDTAPVARMVEERVIAWLAPLFGMAGGHMTAGSTLANLTALWAARDAAGVSKVASSAAAHGSIAKAAQILGLELVLLRADRNGRLEPASVPDDLSTTALVLTAGTTSTGVIDDLGLAGRAAWTHVDAAWAGPLRLSDRYGERLVGVTAADSVAVSAHKWLFQPKDSALVLFREPARAAPAISMGAAYLAAPNIGIMGSRSAAALPLAATLLAWGRDGMAERIERCMALAERWHSLLSAERHVEVLGVNETGVVVWCPRDLTSEAMKAALPEGSVSLTMMNGKYWLRNVAANPNADVDALFAHVRHILSK